MALEDFFYRWLRAYLAAPAWLRGCAGTGYRLLPRHWRQGRGHARFALEAACEDAGAIQAMAHAKLAATLAVALRSVPAFAAYRPLLPRLDDPLACLAALPVCAKADIKRDPDAYLSSELGRERRLPTFTGGSTAEPMRFYLERHVTRTRETAYIDVLSRHLLGKHEHDLTLVLRGRAIADARQPESRLWIEEPIKRELLISADHMERRHLPAHLALLNRRRPRQIQAYPSALVPLASAVLEQGAQAAFAAAVQGILLSSENVLPQQARLFAQAFPHARIVRHYGHSERVLMAVGHGSATEYDFLPLYGHLELLGRDGQAITRPGEPGEIVGTSFDNAAMPFIRYRTGDIGMWAEESAAHRPRLRKIDGRMQEFIVCKDGRLISITSLGAAHFDELARVESIQYEQSEPGCIELKFVSAAALEPPELRRIEAAIRAKTQGGCEVRALRVGHIARTPRGKQRMLIQHLPLPAFFGTPPDGAAGHPVDEERPVENVV